MNDNDTWAIDKIATLLGTAGEWKVEYLEIIADIIGDVRPHPGAYQPDDYARTFLDATERDVVLDFDERRS